MKSQRRKFLIIILVIIAFAAFMLIPRKRYLKDGGTIRYESLWPFYCVEHRHRIHVENDCLYFETGTLVTVLGTEVYNDLHVDYDNPMPAGSSPEDMDRVENAIEFSISE